MKKRFSPILPVLIAVLFAFLFSCCRDVSDHHGEPSSMESASDTTDEASLPETEKADDGPLVIEVLSPGETVETVSPSIRSFMALASYYEEGDYTFSRKTTDDLGNLPEDVSFTWVFDAHEDVARARVVYSKNEDMSQATRILLPRLNKIDQKQNLRIYNLETGTRYYWQIEIETAGGEVKTSGVFHFDTKPGPRILKIDGVKNARDLGGWETSDGTTVLQGLVYRSAKPDDADGNGLHTMINTLKIKTELDLRNPDKEAMDSPLKGNARYVVDDKTGEILETDRIQYVNVVQSSYLSFITKKDQTASALRVFTHPENYPILFHCLAGADRTGSLAFVLNALAGVSETDLVIDYELTPGRFRQGTFTEDYSYDFPGFINAIRAYPGSTLQEKVFYFCKEVCGLSVMEIHNIHAMLTGRTAVYRDPSSSPLFPRDGSMSVLIDPRESGTVESVVINEEALSFTFEDGLLVFSPTMSGSLSAVISFSDGTEMPLDIEVVEAH